MSAPDTNTEKEARRHKPVLYIIAGAAAFGIVMLLSSFSTAVDDGDPSSTASTTVETN